MKTLVTNIALLIGALAMAGCTRTIVAKGTVLDITNGDPIPDAKVIISVWDRGVWDANPLVRIGTTTDAKGRFQISAQYDFFPGAVHCEVCTPGNAYYFTDRFKPNSVIKLSQSGEVQTNQMWLAYKSFSGRWARDINWMKNETTAEPSGGAYVSPAAGDPSAHP